MQSATPNSDLEQGKQPSEPSIDNSPQPAHILPENETRDLSRSLGQRHIQMIALAGAIGTGLFLGLGGALQKGGPLGTLLGYALVGAVVCSVQFALGELSALFPVTGSYVRHAEMLIDPALGFAVGWNVVYGSYLTVPAEISACLVLIQFWTDKYAWLIISGFILLTVLVGICKINVYGEVEFCLAILKIMLIIGVVVMGLVIDLGGVPGVERKGFRYWKNPGPFAEYLSTGSWGQFLGFWSVMTNAVYSFGGVESVSVAAAETKSPRQNIPKACKRVFARVFMFYIMAVLVVGMIVPSNDPSLDNEPGNAAQSPFVIAANLAGIKAVPSIINAIVITSAFSSSNQAMLAGTRILYGLALKRQAPKVFLRTTPQGIPYVCVILQGLIATLAYMALSAGALNVFFWFLNLTAAGVLVSWITISFTHIRLHRAMKTQGISPIELPWNNWWTPYASWFALCASALFLLTGGFSVFARGHWDSAEFISSYLDIVIVLVAYCGWKIYKKTKIVSLEDVPLRAALDEIERTPEEKLTPARGWYRLNILWG